MGDVILLLNKDQFPIHACVYIAGDVVFTKNGGTRYSPCLLMRMADMLSYYLEMRPLRMVILRKNGRIVPSETAETLEAIYQDIVSLDLDLDLAFLHNWQK